MILTIILAICLYAVMGIFVGIKQFHVNVDKKEMDKDESQLLGFFAGVFWPLVLTYYIIRATFFEPWI